MCAAGIFNLMSIAVSGFRGQWPLYKNYVWRGIDCPLPFHRLYESIECIV
jgi:hypothetical protein